MSKITNERRKRQRDKKHSHSLKRKTELYRKPLIDIKGFGKMTPQQALNVLDQASANFTGTRQDHINIQTAVSVLTGAVSSIPVTETKESSPELLKQEQDADNGTLKENETDGTDDGENTEVKEDSVASDEADSSQQ